MKRMTVLSLILLIVLNSCVKDIFDNPKYQRPEWLVGKLYSQAEAEEDLTQIIELINKTSFAEVLDRSGYYTLFAPTDSAFNLFFQNNEWNYQSVEDIPVDYADKLVRYLIIQDGWSLSQLRDMGPNGFGDPSGYKRETLAPPYKFKEISYDNRAYTVVGDNAKFVPLFYQEYLNYYNYTKADYLYFFPDQSWENDDLFYAGAKVCSNVIPAENGFLYKIDKVVSPLSNLEEIIREKDDYSLFRDLSKRFVNYKYDLTATSEQEGFDEGLLVDSLWKKEYAFYMNIGQERIKKGLGDNDQFVNNYSLFAPTNAALNKYLNNEILQNYNRLKDVPEFVLEMIVNAHLRDEVTYPSDLVDGIKNGEGDIVQFDPVQDVYEKMYASNGTFYGLNKVIQPRAIASVMGPVLLRPEFEWFAYAIDVSNIRALIKKETKEFSIFAPDIDVLESDSSFYLQPDIAGNLNFVEYVSSERYRTRTTAEVTDMVFSQIAYGKPEGLAKEEFLQTISGHYIKILNEENQVRGLGNKDSVLFIEEVTGGYDNGMVYSTSGLFQMYSNKLYNLIYNSIDYRKFRDLLIEAELIDERSSKFTFVGENDVLTILVPPSDSLELYTYSSKEDLQNFLKYHFIKGAYVFTDAKNYGWHETYLMNEDNTPIYIQIGGTYDEMNVLDANGQVAASVSEKIRNDIASQGVVHLLTDYIEYKP